MQVNSFFSLYREAVLVYFGTLLETYCVERHFVSVGESGKHRAVDKLAVMLQYLPDFGTVCSGKISEDQRGTLRQKSALAKLIERTVYTVRWFANVFKKQDFSL